MARSQSGYRRFYGGYQPPPGVRIEIKTEEVYQLLVAVSKRNNCTIGKWAQATLKYAMSGEPYIPPPKRLTKATPTRRKRSFELSESFYEEIERRHGEDEATDWIKKTVLSLAQIEAVVMEGEQIEHEWAEKYKI